jgi:hypothetical protein
VIEEERKQAEFNSALEYLRRINTYFELCGMASMNMNSYLWANTLSCLFRELSTQMSVDEVKVRRAELEWLLQTTSSKRVRLSRIGDGVYWKLVDFELFLRKVFKDSGLEMKMKQDAKSILFKGDY